MAVAIARPIVFPLALRDQLLALSAAASDLTQFGEDIWITNRPVGPHTDGTADGLVTYGCVLLNPEGHQLVHGGESYDLPEGALYCFDGRVEHGTAGADGPFAALIWDMPPDYGLARFQAELQADPRFRLKASKFTDRTKETRRAEHHHEGRRAGAGESGGR